MAKEYRLHDIYDENLLLRYRYGDYGIDYKSVLIEPIPNCYPFPRTEHDVIESWAIAARDALEREDRESDIKCWPNHYYQFGMVMLNLAHMSRYRRLLSRKWNQFYETQIRHEGYEYLYSGPCGTPCRDYYRRWFALLGHPDYCEDGLTSPNWFSDKVIEMDLVLSINDLCGFLERKKKECQGN